MKPKKIIIMLFIVLLILIGTYLVVTNLEKQETTNNKATMSTSTTTNIINKKKSISFTVVGDFLFESPFYRAIEKGYDKNVYFNRIKKYFESDDISIGNMEVVIGNENLSVSGDGYNFCAPAFIGDLVNTLDLEVLSTANNHANDRGLDGIDSTIDYFKYNTNIKTVGTYKNQEDREDMRIIEKDGIKVGFLAYTLGTNIKVAKENRNRIGLYRDPDTKTMTEEYKNTLTKEINNLKNNTDIVVVLIHWGDEFTFTPNQEQKDMANFLNSLGVDVIVGSHSHSMQPIEIIGDEHKTLVYYSLGNFVSHDDDIARTPKGQETFDNAYQIGLLSQFTIEYDNDIVDFKDIKTLPIINYFDADLNNFELIPFNEYEDSYETSHNRYNLGLNKNFITEKFNEVIDENYQ